MTEAAQGVKRIVLSGRTMQVCGMMIARSLLCPALLVAALLPACTREIYYREGASQAQITAAQDACVAQAYREAPVRTVTTVLPGTFIPERQVCDGSGNCQTIPARFGPPQIVSTDANEELRKAVQRKCMVDAGYSRVQLPICDQNVRNSQTPAITRTLPPLTGQSCLVPRGGEAFQIITP
jgi:hypothetical protein